MLRYAEAAAAQRNVRGQCTFIQCAADHLERIADASVDVVVTRAVLAYVADKKAALGECFRILKPGGRLSIAEPILQDDAFYARALRKRIEDKSQPADRFLTLLHRWRATQFPDTEEACAKSPIANYSERDIFNLARAAGFAQVHLQLHMDEQPSRTTSWEVFIGNSPHPWAPSLKQILAEQFSPNERQFFEKIVRPTVESGKNVSIERSAYLQALKPLS
jgi:ubiquinone/menaquinone biosynthesis C-methylase UbiE